MKKKHTILYFTHSKAIEPILINMRQNYLESEKMPFMKKRSIDELIFVQIEEKLYILKSAPDLGLSLTI